MGMASTSAQSFNGYALYNLQNQNTTYLIDKDGNIAHSWVCNSSCNYTVLLKDNGNIVRGAVNTSNQLSGSAIGGQVQEYDANANIVWEYTYSNADYCSHHDITLLPNGNVMLIAWEVKSATELTQAGFDNASSDKWPTHFIELQQNGTSADIVWEWHIWDHMIQDHDASKDNFGIIINHPELMDINAITSSGGGPGGGNGDWYHANGIDYNETLDQLVFTSRHASEFFVIDHSTTTAQAATHSGGNSGMGGDFLYRWGNPSNYGSSATQTILAAVHDPRWIEDDGRPNGGYIEFFNNDGASGGGSTIEAVDAPENGFTYTLSGSAYAPTNFDWQHTCLTSHSGQGAHNTMSNGNTFVNVSTQYMYEVDQNGNTVWQYSAGPAKAFRYECDHPGITALLGTDPCQLLSISEESMSQLQYFPNPSTGTFKLDGFMIGDNDLQVTVYDISGKIVQVVSNSLEVDLSHVENGVYFAKMNFDNEVFVTKKLTVVR
jgi:hypothetical protein